MKLAQAGFRTLRLAPALALAVVLPLLAQGQDENAAEPPQPEAEVAANPTCEVCGKALATSHELAVHHAIQHGRTVPILVSVLKELVSEPETGAVKARLSLWTGSAYLYAGQSDKALPLLKEAVQGLPRSPEAHALLGRALKEAGEPGEAQKSVDKARELDPTVPLDGALIPEAEYAFVPREFVAKLQTDFGDSVAKTVPKQVLSEFHAWLAGYHYDLGKAEPTMDAAQRAAQLDPLNPHARSFVGLIAAEGGDCTRAANEVRTALKMDSTDVWVQRAALVVSLKCQTDVIPPQILLVSPLEGDSVNRRTDLELEVRDNSGRLCHVVVNRITISGRSRELADLPGVNGRHRVHWREMKWPALGDDVIEIVATDAYQNTSQARFKFTGRK